MVRSYTKWTQARLSRLRTYVLMGLNDREIASTMGANRVVVQRYRLEYLGLQSTGNRSEGCRRKQAIIMSARNKGVPTITARIKAAHMGWPGVSGTAGARILDILLCGPTTAQAISDHLGCAYSTICTHLRSLKLDKFVTYAKVSYCKIWRLAEGIGKHRTHEKHKYWKENYAGY